MTEFETELEWMQRRADIEDNGFMIHDGWIEWLLMNCIMRKGVIHCGNM